LVFVNGVAFVAGNRRTGPGSPFYDNVMLVGPNGVGKSMLACNLGHQALIQGHTVLFTTAGQ
jgi:KaiC/GvpD/RAD55 family RecA-like ATPase